MASALSPLSMTSYFDNSGELIQGARLHFYHAGTLNPLTVYQDSGLGIPHKQPVVTTGAGRVPPVFVGPTVYRVRVFDTEGVLIEDIDELPGASEGGGVVDPGGGGGEVDPLRLLSTGDIVPAFANANSRVGFVRANGGTIGSAASGASERANADAHDLFVWLWSQDTGNTLGVTPSKGSTAEGDWLANKTLTLPDMRGRALIGMDLMGRSAMNRLAGAAIDSPGGGQILGSYGGRPTVTLTIGQMPNHGHGVNDPGHNHPVTDPGHVHPVTDPGHSHNLTDNGHAHTITQGDHHHTLTDPGHTHTANQSSHSHTYLRPAGTTNVAGPGGAGVASNGLAEHQTGGADPGITITSRTTGITLAGAKADIAINTQWTGITMGTQWTGVGVGSAKANVTLSPATTGVYLSNTGGGEHHTNVQPFYAVCFYIKL